MLHQIDESCFVTQNINNCHDDFLLILMAIYYSLNACYINLAIVQVILVAQDDFNYWKDNLK